MRTSIPKVVFLVLFGVMALNLNAEVITEATIGSGYRSNLFYDSSSSGDAYGSVRMDLKYYPSAFAQLTVGAQFNMFADHRDLSNLTGDMTVTIIPTPETSPLSIAIAGAVVVRRFGSLYELYDQAGGTVGSDFTYRLARWAHLRSSVSCVTTSYTNSDFGSYRGIDASAGVNLTVLGSNALALMADYSRRLFDQPTPTQDGPGRPFAVEAGESETFEITGVCLRYSRPLGERTGMNLSIAHRQLHVSNDYTVLGYTIDYLSPWADLWEGTSLSGRLKHFFPWQVVTEFSCAYLDKNFVDVIELGEVVGDTDWQDIRDDQLITLSLGISRPVNLKSGELLTPSIQIGYRNNQSTTGFFNYEDISASVALKASF